MVIISDTDDESSETKIPLKVASLLPVSQSVVTNIPPMKTKVQRPSTCDDIKQRFDRKRKEKPADGIKKRITTIKSGVAKIVRHSEIREVLKEKVKEVSFLMVEASLFINFFLVQKLNRGLDVVSSNKKYKFSCRPFFDTLLGVVKKPGAKKKRKPTNDKENDEPKAKKTKKDDEDEPTEPDLPSADQVIIDAYMDMRRQNNIGKHNNKFKGNIVNYAADQLETNLETNISTHAYRRLRTFLKKLWDDKPKPQINKDIYLLLSYLFEKEPTKNPDPPADLLKTVNEMFDLPRERGFFSEVKRFPLKYLKFFHEMQRLNEIYEFKNFNLVPLYKHGLKHITVDMSTLHALLCQAKMCPKVDGKLVKRNEIVWEKYLRLKSIREFAGTFTTNGVVVCMKYFKPIRESKPKIIELRDDDQLVGIDPGFRIVLAAVKCPANNLEDRQNVLISSKKYHTDSGYYERKWRLKKITRKIDKEIEDDRLLLEIAAGVEVLGETDGVVDPTKTPIIRKGNLNNQKFTEFQLKWLEKKQAVYGQRRVARLDFDLYIRRAKTIAKYIKEEIVGNWRRTICFFGDATISANSPIKGYIRPPDSAIRKALTLHPRVTVVPTNEWRSTKLCCRCFCPAVVSKSPHRYVSCHFCKKVYNRDTNGAQNILTVGLNELKKSRPILQFTRGFVWD